ncbi:MAG: NUDIX hydrolase [Planctomycetota bacterium]
MSVTPWKPSDRRELARTRVITVYEQRFDCVDHPERSGDFTVIDCVDWVNVVAITPKGELVLIEQFRYGTAANTLEIPGGMVDPGEDPAAAGVRELLEETGYAGGPGRVISVMDANPAILTNRVHTVLVERAVRTAEPSLDEHEQIEVKIVALSAVPGMIARGEISHTVVVSGLFRALDELGWIGPPG